jgi:hypothetical protein
MAHDQQSIDRTKEDCRHHEKVHRGDPVSVVTKERLPPLRRRALLRAIYLATLVWPISMPSGAFFQELIGQLVLPRPQMTNAKNSSDMTASHLRLRRISGPSFRSIEILPRSTSGLWRRNGSWRETDKRPDAAKRRASCKRDVAQR